MDIKNMARSVLNFLHLDLTKNLEYDRLTKLIMKREITSGSNCIDVGCHKGEMLDEILKFAPNGTHYAFEPIPYMYDKLIENYKSKATIHPYALSSKNGISTFQLVKNAPAYSGINKRRYDVAEPEIEEIEVELKKMDEVIPTSVRVDFIKIDVEGGEFDVLKGAKELLIRNKPLIIFECGMGASDYYGTNPSDLFLYLTEEIGLSIYTLKSFIQNKGALSSEQFNEHFEKNDEYYFIAK